MWLVIRTRKGCNSQPCHNFIMSFNWRIKMRKEIDITGKRFGRLMAICKSSKKNKWLFKCDCGKEKEILKYNVTQGATKSCGCLETESRKLKTKREKNPEKYIGLSYNNLTIKSFDHYNKNGQMYFLCSCSCGNEKIIRHSHLKRGRNKILRMFN